MIYHIYMIYQLNIYPNCAWPWNSAKIIYTQYKHWKRKHIPSIFAFKTKKLTNYRFVSYLRCYPTSVFVKIIALTTCANQLDNEYN